VSEDDRRENDTGGNDQQETARRPAARRRRRSLKKSDVPGRSGVADATAAAGDRPEGACAMRPVASWPRLGVLFGVSASVLV